MVNVVLRRLHFRSPTLGREDRFELNNWLGFMNTLTAALCKKPIIGVVMWLSSMCASNQAIRDGSVLDLSKGGEIFTQEISIPMDENYHLSLKFNFGTWTDYEAEGPAGSIKDANNTACNDIDKYASLSSNERARLGAEIVLDIKATTPNGEQPANMNFISRCVHGWGEKAKWRSNELGQLSLKKGKYRLSISNLKPITIPSGTKVFVYLTGAGAGYP